MLLPKGTPFMPEGLLMTTSDLTNVLRNLTSEPFSGYLHFQPAKDHHAWVFLSKGTVIESLEQRPNGTFQLQKTDRLISKAGPSGVPTASYILSPKMARVLAGSFGFQATLQASQVKPADLMEHLSTHKHSGFLRLGSGNRSRVVVLDQGQPCAEIMVQRYGEVLCGKDSITALLGLLKGPSPAVQVFTENAQTLEAQSKKLHRDLENMVHVNPKATSGLFASKDTLKLDFEFLRQWNLPAKNTFQLTVQNNEGVELGVYKCQGAASKSQVLDVPAKILTSWGLESSEQVVVFPAGE
jgi:hypothetical protein